MAAAVSITFSTVGGETYCGQWGEKQDITGMWTEHRVSGMI